MIAALIQNLDFTCKISWGSFWLMRAGIVYGEDFFPRLSRKYWWRAINNCLPYRRRSNICNFKPGRDENDAISRANVVDTHMVDGRAREKCGIALGDTLTVEVLGEENSGVRGHRAAPARVLNIVARAVDAAIFRPSVAFHAMHRGTRFTERGALQL